MNILSRNQPGDDRHGLRARLIDTPYWLRWGLPAFAVVLAAFLCWLGFQALNTKSHLEQARSYAQQTKDALLAGKTADATRWAENAEFNAQQAQAASHSVPFTIAAAVPVIGSPLKTIQQISNVVVGLASDVLIPATKVGGSISPDKLVEGPRVNLKLLRQEQPQLSDLAAAAARLDAQAQAIGRPAYLSMVGDARFQLQDQTAKLSSLLSNSSIAAQLAPPMLGVDGPRSYLMGFQTNAEARGTGGLVGGFGVLRFADGVPTVDTLAPNTELQKASADVDLGPEFDKVYGWTNPYTDFRNSNLSAHFPYAAEIWRSMWQRQTNTSVDGVIALDPVALGYVLGVIGPVRLADGEEITAGNVVELTESTAYIRFPTDQQARKKYLQDIANAVVKKMTGPLPSPRGLLEALGRAAGERRLAVWSAIPSEQEILETTPLAHVIPDDDAPYAQVIVNNLAGNKMDYYLARSIEYAADGCEGETRNSTVTVRLTNTATDRPLPDYVAGLPGLSPKIPLTAPRGTMVSSVRVLATKGARLLSVTSNGERTPAISYMENGRPSFEVQIAIPPGNSGELTFRLSEPTSPGTPRVPIQPLIDDVEPRISVPTCAQ